MLKNPSEKHINAFAWEIQIRKQKQWRRVTEEAKWQWCNLSWAPSSVCTLADLLEEALKGKGAQPPFCQWFLSLSLGVGFFILFWLKNRGISQPGARGRGTLLTWSPLPKGSPLPFVSMASLLPPLCLCFSPRPFSHLLSLTDFSSAQETAWSSACSESWWY